MPCKVHGCSKWRILCFAGNLIRLDHNFVLAFDDGKACKHHCFFSINLVATHCTDSHLEPTLSNRQYAALIASLTSRFLLC